MTITASSAPKDGTAASDPVGSYKLTPSAATGRTFTASNYTIAYFNGALTVNMAALTVTADDSRGPTARQRELTFKYAGFGNGDTSAVIGGVNVAARGPRRVGRSRIRSLRCGATHRGELQDHYQSAAR